MSFLGNPPTPSPQAEPDIVNDGWFPNVSPQAMRLVARLDGTVTVERLRYSLTAALLEVNRQLSAWKADRLAESRAHLADVPSPQVGSTTAKVEQYLRAVYSGAQADLAERYRDFDTTGAGDKRVERMACPEDSFRRDMRWALCDLRDIPRTTVELI